MSNPKNSHKNIRDREGLVSWSDVFPEDHATVVDAKRFGDIDNYRASWEDAPRTDSLGRVSRDDSNKYEG